MLRGLLSVLKPDEEQAGDPVAPKAMLCPMLRSTYSPRSSWQQSLEALEQQGPPAWSRVWPVAPGGPALGLSLARNSKRPARHGLSGMSRDGRRNVSRALRIFEEIRSLLSFWTVSLPTAALFELNSLGSLPAFQDRLRKELGRLLQRKGLPPLIVGVVEIQPKRSRELGIPCPHWHVVFQGRSGQRNRWALTRADLDGVIAAALASAGVHAPAGATAAEWLKSAGNVQQVKKSVRAYLAKYMTKGSGSVEHFVGTLFENLIPKQWWFWSEPARELTLEHVGQLNFSFLKWCHKHRFEIQEAGLAVWRALQLSDPRAPMTFQVNWLSLDKLSDLIHVWWEECWDLEWFRSYHRSRGETLPSHMLW